MMKQLNPQDTQYLLMEDSNIASHITSVAICNQKTAPGRKVRFKDILTTVEERLSKSPIYSQKLMRLPFDMDFPYWVEDPYFDLEYHVRHARLPKPSDWRQFCIQVARFHSRPLDLSRPLWEIFVIEGLDNVEGCEKGSFAYCMKMHHAAVDGTSAQEFMALMLDLAPKGFPLLPPPAPGSPHAGGGKVRQLGAAEIMMRAAVSNAKAPIEMMRKTARLAPQLAKTALAKQFEKPGESHTVPVTRFNAQTSPNKAFDGISFRLADFKMIAKAFDGAKVNDVVLAVTSGALRDYLQSKDELPSQSLIVTAPINKRSKNEEAGKGEGNNITAMNVPLYTNIQDPVDRLKAIIRASKKAKSGNAGLTSRLITDLSQHIPAPTLASLGPVLLRSGIIGGRVCNAIVSNVMAPPVPIYFCGAEVTHTYALAPIGGGVGLFIATPSYNGKMAFSITTTRQIMPDTPVFTACLEKALEDLKRAAAYKMALKGDEHAITAQNGVLQTKAVAGASGHLAQGKTQRRSKKTIHKTRARPAPGKQHTAVAPARKRASAQKTGSSNRPEATTKASSLNQRPASKKGSVGRKAVRKTPNAPKKSGVKKAT